MKKIFLIALLLNLASMGQLHAQLFGGQLKSSTSPYPGGTVHCDPQSRTAVVTVTTLTGRIWMDRNLGAQQVATNRQDPLSYGDFYQWGRGADGHQCRNSGTQTIQSTSDQPGHGNFITRSTSSSTSDWRNPHNGTLWQGVNGVNNPCPLGFRIPTEAEFNLEKGLWNQNDPFAGFNSVLKIPFMGFRETDGVIPLPSQLPQFQALWTSTISNNQSKAFQIRYDGFNGDAYVEVHARAHGYSVRCIKN